MTRKSVFSLFVSVLSALIFVCPASAQTSGDFLVRGFTYKEKGNYDLAIAEFTKAIEADPKHTEAYIERGNSYESKGSFEQAIADLNKAVQIDPKNPHGYFSRGIAYANKRRYDQAIADLTKTIELDPKHGGAYYNRGFATLIKSNYEQAIADFTKVIESAPEFANAYFNRGDAYRGTGNYEQAITDYDKALELNPKATRIYNSRAWADLLSGNGAAAYTDASTFLELYGLKDDAPYAVLVGYYGLRKSGKTTEANKFLKKWIAQLDREDWTTKILQYLDGSLTEAQLLALAIDNDKLTQAHAYIGEMQLLSGKPDRAKIHFNWVKDNGRRSMLPYHLAIAELKRLSPSPAQNVAGTKH